MRGSLKAAAVGLLPLLWLIGRGGYRSVLIVVVGIPSMFVVAAAAWEVYRELSPVEQSPPPRPSLGPKGVSTQLEAQQLFDEMTARIREREA